LAWRFRKSKRLPGGFRLNLSKSGLGYSWGFRGFRVGRDSHGRIVRTLSIPGTGLYNRQYLSSGAEPQQNSGRQSLGGCLGTIVFVLLFLAILGKLTESGNTVGLIVLLLVALGGFVILKLQNKPNIRQAEVTPENYQRLGQEVKESHEGFGPEVKQNYEGLGQEVKGMFVDLATPVKNELRKSRGASAYDDIFTGEFFALICRFAALDGTIDASEGKVFLEIFKALHPRMYAGLSPDDAVTLLEGHRQRHPETLQVPIIKSLLFRLTQQAGEQFANSLKGLMYKVALQVALADGPLSPNEQAELEKLRNAPEATAKPTEEDVGVRPPDGDATPNPPDSIPSVGPEHLDQHPIIDPHFTFATGIVTIDILKDKTKEFVELLEPLLKVELQKLGQASNARLLVEQDIRAVIIRAGFSNGSISEYAAHLYLELFTVLHPTQFGQWKTQDALEVLQSMVDKNRDIYIGSPKKPVTLQVLEAFDATHGTGTTKSTRDFLLVIAVFAASKDGKLSDEKTAEIDKLRLAFESA
jgi:tellurite resistance protein